MWGGGLAAIKQHIRRADHFPRAFLGCFVVASCDLPEPVVMHAQGRLKTRKHGRRDRSIGPVCVWVMSGGGRIHKTPVLCSLFIQFRGPREAGGRCHRELC